MKIANSISHTGFYNQIDIFFDSRLALYGQILHWISWYRSRLIETPNSFYKKNIFALLLKCIDNFVKAF